MKKFIPFIIILILLVPLSIAVKETQTSTSLLRGLTIRIPQVEYLTLNQAVSSRIHVYNTSSGLIVGEDTTSCILHLYNKTGSHTLQEDYIYDSNLMDFELNIHGNNFSYIGVVSYVIQCNTSTDGGFVSGSLEVTRNGSEPLNNDFPLAISIVITAFLFLYWGFKLDDEHFLLKLLFFFITLFLLMIVPSVFINGWEIIKIRYSKIILWSFRIFVTYFFIYLAYFWGKKSEWLGKITGRRK